MRTLVQVKTCKRRKPATFYAVGILHQQPIFFGIIIPCIIIFCNGIQAGTLRIDRLEPVGVMRLRFCTCPTGFTPAELRHADTGAVHTATRGLCKLCKALAGCSQAHSAVGGVQPGSILGQIPLFPAADVPLPGTLHLGYLVGGVLFAVPLDVPGVQGFQLLTRPRGRVAQLREAGKELVSAVPTAKPCSRAVAGGGFKVRVVLALVIDRAAPVELPALPLSVGRSCPAVGGGLEELHAHLVGAGHLQLASCLVHAGQDGTAGGHLDAVLMPAGIGDHGHVVCKAVHGLFDGGFVVEGTGAHLEPCSVQCALKGPCDGVCRGGGEVLPCAAGLPRAGIQQVVQGGALFKGRRLHVVVVVDGVLPLHGFGGGLQKQLADGRFAFAAVAGQQLHNIIAHRFGLLVAPQLPVSGGGHGVHLADAPGNVL